MLIINLNTQSAVLNGKDIIKNGKATNSYHIRQNPVTITELEKLYDRYKHSIPDNIHYKYIYFNALPYNKLNAADMIKGINRRKSKEELELALLEGILNGSLVWHDETKWFWQSENDKDFILLKQWFLPERSYNAESCSLADSS